MIKLLLIGDRHNSEHIPKSRKDNFVDTCLKKDLEIIELAKTNHVDLIVHPGDFWTDADYKLKNDFIANTASLWDNIYDGNRKIPLIGIAGNHDLIGENLNSLSTTTTGLLDALGIFKLVDKNNPFILKKDNKTLVITGTNYHKGMDKPEFINDYIVSQHLGDVHMHIVHGMLSYKGLGKLIRHTKIENILETKADITFAGHDHNGFGIIKENDKLFINPGAVVRLSADKKEIARTVGVVLLTIDDNIEAEFIPLKSALPAEDVLDRDEIEKKNEFSEFTEELKDKVKHMDIGKSMSFDDILEDIYKEKNISTTLKADIKNSIDKNLTQQMIPLKWTADDCYIKKIHLINFQSHKNTIIDLDRNFNVIVGESRQGKSAVLRAIRWVIENKPSGKSFIKIGESEAIVEITLGNGTIIKRFVNKKENGYKIFFTDGTLEEGNTKMVTRVQEVMGYSNFKVDENSSIPINFLRQGDGWYLIGDQYTSTDRARILGALKNTNAADTSIKEIEKDNLSLQNQIRRAENDLKTLHEETIIIEETLNDKEHLLQAIDKRLIIDKIDKHQELEDNYRQCEKLSNQFDIEFSETSIYNKISILKNNIDKLLKIRRYLSIYKESIVIANSNNDILNKLNNIDNLLSKKRNLENKLEKIEKIKSSQVRIIKESNRIKVVDNSLIQLNNVNLENFNKLKENLLKYERIRLNYTTYFKSKSKISFADNFIQNSIIVESFNTSKYDILKKIDEVKKIDIIKQRIKTELLNLGNKNTQFEKVNLNLDELIEKKIEILSKNNVCPTCYQSIDEDKIEEIFEKIKGNQEVFS